MTDADRDPDKYAAKEKPPSDLGSGTNASKQINKSETTTSVKWATENTTDKVGKQVDIQFGIVDFQRLTKSEKSLKSIQPRRLWSDRSEDDEEILPSLLAMSALPF